MSTPPAPILLNDGLAQLSIVGVVLMLWSQFELTLELLIQRELRLTLEEVCIVCGPLGGGAKTSLAYALLNREKKNAPFVKAAKDFQTVIGRNTLAHGFLQCSGDQRWWSLVSREVKDQLKVKTKTVVPYADGKMVQAFDKMLDLSGFTGQQLHDYGEAIKSLV